MMAAVKEGKVPAGIKQVPGEPLVWSDPQTPRYQYRADVDGARVTVTKIDTQGQKSLTPNSKLFQPQQVFETSIEKPQMGIVTVTKRTTDTVTTKSDGGTAVSGKDVGDTPGIKPTDTSVTAPTPANPTTPLGPISIINAPGEAARAASEPPLSGWKKAAAVFAGVIAAPLAYLGIGNDSVNTAPPAATAPQAPTTTKEAVVEEIPVDVPAGLEGDGCFFLRMRERAESPGQKCPVCLRHLPRRHGVPPIFPATLATLAVRCGPQTAPAPFSVFQSA
jgi:hypothetical protein